MSAGPQLRTDWPPGDDWQVYHEIVRPADETLVQVQFADGGLSPAEGVKARHFAWESKAPWSLRIVRYRVIRQPAPPSTQPRHAHYFKSVRGLEVVDVYRVLQLFEVTDPCLQHAIKKLLVPGARGAGKDTSRDVQEAIDTLTRWQAMQTEVRHE